MSRIAYADCFSGASGDMMLGGLVSAGVQPADLRSELAKLPLDGYSIAFEQVRRAGLSATHARVEASKAHPHRRLAEIRTLVDASRLPDEDRRNVLDVFDRLIEAEANVHGIAPDEVELHEVGAVDAIVDVVGAVVGLRLLGVDRLYVSALPVGAGSVKTAHGTLPVPAPATLELLVMANAPLIAAPDPPTELVTPTGAALLTVLGTFERPAMRVTGVGVGAGSREIPGRPNVMRLWVGEALPEPAVRSMSLVETNIDDMNPEILPHVIGLLLQAGAGDAWVTPIVMKKGRPAFQLSALCDDALLGAITSIVLRETSTLGLRIQRVERQEAEREVIEFQSSLGPAAVKAKRLDGRLVAIAPEFERCREIAQSSGLPLQEVYRAVEAEAWQSLGGLPAQSGIEHTKRGE